MCEQDVHSNKYFELRSKYAYYIDLYKTLYQLHSEKEEELNLIYKLIKSNLIDSKKHEPTNII